MGVKITGLTQLRKSLDKLSENAKKASGEYSFEELFNEGFMARHASVATFQELLDKSGFKVETADDFRAIPDNAWDEHVRTYTCFSNWEHMQQSAAKELIAKKLGIM